MLIKLTMVNFALAEQVCFDFGPGLHLITGDTGAGKSLIFDALHLLAGQKSDAIWVREGKAKADLECELRLDLRWPAQQAMQALAQEYDLLDDDDPDCLVVRRVIHRDGRSKAYINGTSVRAALLKQLTNHCFLFHDQHESVQLLKPEAQLGWLDRFAGLQGQVAEYARNYQGYLALLREREQRELEVEKGQLRQDYLQFQLDELSALNLEPNYINQLETQINSKDHAQRWLGQAVALQELIDSDSQWIRRLRQWQSQVGQDAQGHGAVRAAAALVETAMIHLDEAQAEVTSCLDVEVFDEQDIAIAQQELNRLYELARKHRVQVSELSELSDRFTQEISALEASSLRLVEVKQELAQLKAQLEQRANVLSEQRQMNVQALEQLLSQKLAQLGMHATTWQIELQSNQKLASRGSDAVRFLMSSNPGHSPQPLTKVASGGELARVSLVLHSFAHPENMVQGGLVYLFDEVDVGVSGVVASAIGQLLQALGDQQQVLCISHAPQVAARSGTHWHGSKHDSSGIVASYWRRLSGSERIDEIARMLGSEAESGVNLAKQLLTNDSRTQKLMLNKDLSLYSKET